MKAIIGYLARYWRETFDWRTYGYASAFLVLIIGANFGVGIETWIASNYFGTFTGIVLFAAVYATAYYGMAVPVLLIAGRADKLRATEFWWKSALLVGIMTMRRASVLYADWAALLTDNSEDYRFLLYVLLHANRLLFTFAPLILLKLWWDKSRVEGLYGLHFRRFDFSPYVLLLLAMLPLIAWASFQPDFLLAYPRFKPWLIGSAFGMSEAQMAAGFEIVYALNFVTVELLFRGALVIGMAHILGRDCILPMVALYASIHFGKPLGECIGSIFGGYILGVIALYTRNIWGGTFVHIGVALLMELAAYLQHFAER